MIARFESLEAFLDWARDRQGWELVKGEARRLRRPWDRGSRRRAGARRGR